VAWWENGKDLPPSVPAYFKRRWEHGLNAPLTIYGRAIRSTFKEDWPTEKRAWELKELFMSECWSTATPEPELGFQPLSEVEEISRAHAVKTYIKEFGVRPEWADDYSG
jgi:hypothetical protein